MHPITRRMSLTLKTALVAIVATAAQGALAVEIKKNIWPPRVNRNRPQAISGCLKAGLLAKPWSGCQLPQMIVSPAITSTPT